MRSASVADPRSPFRSLVLAATVALAACGGVGTTATDTPSGTGGTGGGKATGGAAGAGGKSAGTGGKSAGTGGVATGTGGAGGGVAGTGGAPTGIGGASGTGGASGATQGGASGVAGASASAGASGAAGPGGTGGAAGASGSAQAGASGSGVSGGAGQSGAAGSGCVPKSCMALGSNCGPTADGCGGIVQCGACPVGQTCGANAKPNQCGTPPCTPNTCAKLGLDCGPASDGCGGVLACGACPVGQTCGGAKPGVCGTTPCTPKSCGAQGISCGPAGDGCGAALDCGSCPVGQSCGGGGVPGACGAPTCVPKTCADFGFDCGPAPDGCGNLIQCGKCNQPDTCGGGGGNNVCGVPPSCTNLCLQQVTCPNPAVTTTLSGTVYAPNGVDPLPNAAVYVPNAAVKPFTPGVSCDTCGEPASGSPLVSAVTTVDGTFTLKNVPVGANIPLVIQIGRWRRQVTIPSVASCTDTKVPASLTHLPRNKGEGDIPLMAFSTGSVDALECVIRKIGVDDSEFTAPAGGGRVHLYMGLIDPNSQNKVAAGGAKAPTSPNEDQLWGTQAALNQYDMVLFPCQADQTSRTPAQQQRLINYANAGGRVFATHFSYIWLYNDVPFSGTANWNVEQHPSPPNQTGYVDTSFPKGAALAQWLQTVNASTTYGQIPLQILRHDHDDVIAPSQAWMTIDDAVFPGAIVHYTFNTPVGAPAASQCGRVLFDDFHVENVKASQTTGVIFPAECLAGPMTAQEKLLEYMIFDLASCITPDIPVCTPKTCGDLGVGCGPAGDGCGNVLACGVCAAGQSCGGGGVPSQCGAPTCAPESCAAQGIQCGPAGDGCGNLLACGSCPTGQTCGGGGKAGVCGTQACTPLTCAGQGISCGPAGDGCGNLLACGSCPMGQTCGGAGKPGVCGVPPCTPNSCANQGINCGPTGDGCGGVIQCGTCMVPQSCGGGGVPGVCGGNGKP